MSVMTATRFALPPLPSHTADPFDMVALASKLPPAIPKRPAHRRGRSTRSEKVDILRELRHVFQRGLTKSWGTSASFKALARDFFAAAIGLSPGHAIANFNLNQFQTALLAVELARIINTADVIMVTDPHNHVLTVCHTLTLIRRLDTVVADETIFIIVDSGKPVTVTQPSFDLPWLAEAHTTLRNVLRTSSDQLLQASSLGWTDELTRRRMLTLADWLIDAPVCFVADECAIPEYPIQDLLASEQFWQFTLRLDGHEPENDHIFNPWRIPVSVFNSELSSIEMSPVPADGITNLHSFTAVQDKMQTKMFHALNTIDMAARIWSDVSIITEG